MDKWQQHVLASYSNEQIEQELLAFCQHHIEGTRQREGVTEYLLPYGASRSEVAATAATLKHCSKGQEKWIPGFRAAGL